MAKLEMKQKLSVVLFSEAALCASRKVVTIANTALLALGTVVGKYLLSIPTTGVVTGTGNGTCTGVAGGPNTKKGDYVLTCIDASVSGSEIFSVLDPDGEPLPNATVGVAYVNDNINFTINDGTTDFIVGDTITISVVAGNGKYRALNLTAVNGTQKAAGILIAQADANGQDVEAVIVAKDAVVIDANLVWPDGATADQKAAALAELEALGFSFRSAA